MFAAMMPRCATSVLRVRTIIRPSIFHRCFATAHVNASLIKRLREMTGAPITECKEALVASISADEATNDDAILNRAHENLRRRNVSLHQRKSGRSASEGHIVAVSGAHDTSTADGAAAIVEVNCETDFCARNDQFVSLCAAIGHTAFVSGADSVDVLKEAPVTGKSANGTVGGLLHDTVGALRENINIRRLHFARTNAQSVVGVYAHNQTAPPADFPNVKIGRHSALIVLTADRDLSAVERRLLSGAAYKLAMQAVATRPQYCHIADIPADAVDKERSIIQAAAAADGKANARHIDKLIGGRLNKWYEECVLDEQKLVVMMNDDGADTDERAQKVCQWIQEFGKQHNMKLSISRLCRYDVGEGADKVLPTFVDEVKAKVAQARPPTTSSAAQI